MSFCWCGQDASFTHAHFGTPQIIVGTLLVLGLAGCPKPTPTPVNPTPDAADAAPLVSCDVACVHVATIPGGPSFNTCMGVCQPIQSPAFAPCINNAKTVTDINACDH